MWSRHTRDYVGGEQCGRQAADISDDKKEWILGDRPESGLKRLTTRVPEDEEQEGDAYESDHGADEVHGHSSDEGNEAYAFHGNGYDLLATLVEGGAAREVGFRGHVSLLRSVPGCEAEAQRCAPARN